jgi:hypothetical protein
MTTIQIIGAIAAGVSAICWSIAAVLATPVLSTYWDGVPPSVARRLKLQFGWNAAAAVFASVAALMQALSFIATSG